jgi:hypothetical protein
MVMPKSIEEQSEIEAFRERIRQMPGVIVRRPNPPVPYTPWIRVVTGDVDIRELLGRRDLDEDDDEFVDE